jgi:hypothetical protein
MFRSQNQRKDQRKLLQLLARLDEPLSLENPHELWVHEDFVSASNLYVTIRHFTNDRLGKRVSLVRSVQKLKHSELREYRLCRPQRAYPNEHIGVYVYNPASIHPNAVTLKVHSGLAQDDNDSALEVQPDTCPLVHTIPVADMHDSMTVFLTDTDTRFGIHLCFYFE